MHPSFQETEDSGPIGAAAVLGQSRDEIKTGVTNRVRRRGSNPLSRHREPSAHHLRSPTALRPDSTRRPAQSGQLSFTAHLAFPNPAIAEQPY